MIQVFEPDATNALVNETDYQYDTLDNLICAVQKGTDTTAFSTCAAASATWRPRSFTYNSLSQLLTASNPESGTITYTYNNDSTLATKVAPAPNQTGSLTVTTMYSYDTVHRVTQKSYSDGTTPTVKYGYDAIAPSGCTLPTLTINNGIGKRTGMCDAAGAEAWSYDITANVGWKTTDARTTTSVTKSTIVQNNLAGSTATLTYPSGRIITYTYDTAARPVSAVDSTGPINYATDATYAPQGALSSLTNGAGLVSTFYYNSRLQPCRISVKVSGTAPTQCADAANIGNVMDFSYNFSLGAANNGNVTAITNSRDNLRSQSFTYDVLNRLATAQTNATAATSLAKCWGEAFAYDQWANLLSISGASAAYTGCTQENLSVTATTKNQISGNTYDAAGNLITIPSVATYTYNAENQLISTAGVTYTYDGDGRRVKKSSGKLYWYGMGSDPLTETDPVGTPSADYIFFNRKRTARLDLPSAVVHYYFSDHLGSANVVTSNTGTIQDESDYYPFGGERIITNSDPNQYKFTGKERDSESGLDNFGARYNSSSMGRFMTPDPINLTAKRLINPANTLNKYAYGGNNPLFYVDPTGQDITAFYRAPSGLKDGGHILLAVTNQATGAVRFADYYPKNGNKDSFLPVPGGLHDLNSDRLKDHAALTIQTTPEVAQKVIDAIDALSKDAPNYWLPTSSCANICSDLLNLAGIDVPSTLTSPTDVWSTLYGSYSAEALDGGQLHMGFSRYQAGKDFGSPMSAFPKGTDPFYNLQLLYLLANQQRNQKPPRACTTIQGPKGPETHCVD